MSADNLKGTTPMLNRTTPVALFALLNRLKVYAVNWKFSLVPTENVEYEPGTDRGVVDHINDANVVSSELKSVWGEGEKRHAVLLDIDYPAYLIPSSSPNHYHLYLDVPGGVGHDDYMELLALLGRLGIIEHGYAEVSIKRGNSDLRLPWVNKTDQRVGHLVEMPTSDSETEVDPHHYWQDSLRKEDLF